ncbi:Z1 domain-containing protein [Streptomyces lunaelactis]|uniref:Z1 domain-containing protein n=1 Tax=Streptomyces lunaelactis TaxID=1535768 RepID=UPI001584D2F7|nr:Z1 domain-containing protein [Streptomyces lunaelactis]NUK07538.1 Z1 domain-containing protein [Streptomyces lunaelactis]NUK56807.1 Z1 domain-containing protein [Streptomyces lunaelactis]NUL12905.1 Z1 domain-containing protein [Streptomyces lunaelactis]NUL21410.1 Z1 domain-containing protein [Streptomyces lunaelactis]
MKPTEMLRLTLHTSALAGMDSRPKNLVRALAYQSEEEGPDAELLAAEEDFRATLNAAHSTDQLVELWRKQLTQWDYTENPAWTPAEPRTDERRAAVLTLLGLSEDTQKILNLLVPVPKASGPVVISDSFTPWYTPQSQQGRSWYWPAYRRLLSQKGWPETAVASLDSASDRVVERLADPTSDSAYQSKGLVVGYVQSGKTANFTGVIAKAVDAGYRLVIILGGTLNLLRAQTQRRLDMELVGRENILRGASEYESDYADDPAWPQGKFLSHGGLPSALGGFDIVRMTTRDNDYKSLLQGIVALEFEKQEPALRLHDPRNLHRSSARLMVVKKNKTVLAKLVKDLTKIKTPLAEIPVLIIDDESDEASVNTANPNKPDTERTAINDKISELLRLLPRAQYVGYTATPFANVFIDPSDTEDIFPKDFIVSLPRPTGYMGVQDFHDLDSPIPPEERTFANSNEKAHVRDIHLSSEEDDTALQQAMDMFVLTAAMKLYREANGLGDRHFQHHTMLIHESVRTADHRELRGRVLKMWWEAGYTGPSGHARLRELFETDVSPVSLVRSDGFPVPPSYDDLSPFIGAAAIRIGGDDQPIIVVNGDKDIENGEADFDKRSLWKILIGGQKLARGFTIEGLTVTYYRRRTNNASTLMQMGRWFGFRKGYQDLVRLYLGREETMGTKDIDLYEAFEAICRDEESFREQLEQYSVLIDGKPQVTPEQVPPLVSQHLAWLKPASANKMYNTRVVEIHSPGKWEEPTAYPSGAPALRHNTGLWTPVLESLSSASSAFAYYFDEAETHHRFNALTGKLSSAAFLSLLRSLKWDSEGRFAPHLTYLEEISGTSPAKVEDWLVLAPQHASRNKQFSIGASSRTLSWFGRQRRRGEVFGAISEPKHRAAALRIAGALSHGGNDTTEQYVAERRGVISLYPVVEPEHRQEVEASGRIDPSKVVMAFTFVAPASAGSSDGKVVRFTTIDSKDAVL